MRLRGDSDRFGLALTAISKVDASLYNAPARLHAYRQLVRCVSNCGDWTSARAMPRRSCQARTIISKRFAIEHAGSVMREIRHVRSLAKKRNAGSASVSIGGGLDDRLIRSLALAIGGRRLPRVVPFIFLVLLDHAVQRSWTIGLGGKRYGRQDQDRSDDDRGHKLFHDELPDHAFHAKRCASRGRYRRGHPCTSNPIYKNKSRRKYLKKP